MNQDLSRFNVGDKGSNMPVKFMAGDKVILQVVLRGNTYSLNNPAYGPSSLENGTITAQSGSATTSATAITKEDYYLLEFTLA